MFSSFGAYIPSQGTGGGTNLTTTQVSTVNSAVTTNNGAPIFNGTKPIVYYAISSITSTPNWNTNILYVLISGDSTYAPSGVFIGTWNGICWSNSTTHAVANVGHDTGWDANLTNYYITPSPYRPPNIDLSGDGLYVFNDSIGSGLLPTLTNLINQSGSWLQANGAGTPSTYSFATNGFTYTTNYMAVLTNTSLAYGSTIGGPTITNAFIPDPTINYAIFSPTNIPTGVGLVHYAGTTGPNQYIITNTVANGFDNIDLFDNFAITNVGQVEVIEKRNGHTVVVWESANIFPAAAVPTNYVVYRNSALTADVNGPRTSQSFSGSGAITSDGGFALLTGALFNGWSYGVRIEQSSTNSWRIVATTLSGQPVLGFQSGGISSGGQSFELSPLAIYDSFFLMSNGMVSLKIGLTNNFGAELDLWGNVVIPVASHLSTQCTNTLTFTTVSSFTNTLGHDAMASFSAGTSIVIKDRYGNTIDTLGTIATLHQVIYMRAGMQASGTAVSAILY